MVVKCPKCGSNIPEESSFCPSCGTRIEITPAVRLKGSNLPLAGGLLAIIAACVCLFVGILGTLAYARHLYVYHWLFLLALIAFVGFVFGLFGGMAALRRKYFEIALLGASFLMLAGIVDIVVPATARHGIVPGTIVGTSVLILSILSLIFIAVSYIEFD